MKIDPWDPSNHGKPLWVVYGYSFSPQIFCAKLRAYTVSHQLLPVGERGLVVCIWGYSVYKGKPGFRTLGLNVDEWAKRSHMKPRFFDSQAEAIHLIRMLVTPKECINE